MVWQWRWPYSHTDSAGGAPPQFTIPKMAQFPNQIAEGWSFTVITASFRSLLGKEQPHFPHMHVQCTMYVHVYDTFMYMESLRVKCLTYTSWWLAGFEPCCCCSELRWDSMWRWCLGWWSLRPCDSELLWGLRDRFSLLLWSGSERSPVVGERERERWWSFSIPFESC